MTKELKSFTGANFTGFLGESFRFCTLDDKRQPSGPLLTGTVERIFRSDGRRIFVSIYVPQRGHTYNYPAAQVYYHGRPREGFR